MESQPQNPEFRNNPENFHPCTIGFNRMTSALSEACYICKDLERNYR